MFSAALRRSIACAVTTLATAAAAAGPEPARPEPPVIPIGLDAYRQWDRWPYQRIGARADMRSTYDRRGNNESADAGHFLYQQADDFNVTLDVEGPGVLYFARYNHWHGSPWRYEIDGRDHIVQESTSANPLKRVPNSVFLLERRRVGRDLAQRADVEPAVSRQRVSRAARSDRRAVAGARPHAVYAGRPSVVSGPAVSWRARLERTALLGLLDRDAIGASAYRISKVGIVGVSSSDFAI
ncbi:MAG: hypothetical protein ACT4QC_04535 [Planctomycetaceae bacterium]